MSGYRPKCVVARAITTEFQLGISMDFIRVFLEISWIHRIFSWIRRVFSDISIHEISIEGRYHHNSGVVNICETCKGEIINEEPHLRTRRGEHVSRVDGRGSDVDEHLAPLKRLGDGFRLEVESPGAEGGGGNTQQNTREH